MAALTVVLLCFGAQTVVRNRDWASDLTLFSRVLDYYPDNAKAQYNVALLKYQASQKDEALAGVERALNIYPDNIDARILRARLYVEARQYDQAEKLLLEVRRTRFRTDNLYEMLGEVYVQSGQIDKAVSVYREGLNAFPGSYSLAYNLASVYMSRNDFAMAEPLWRRAIAVRRAPEPHFGLGYILLMRGQFPEAEQEFSLATASVSTGKLAAKFQAYCQIRLSRIDAAKMTLERLLPSGDREVYVMLAYLATIQGSRAAAAQYLHSAGPMDATACNDMSFKDICNEVLMLR